MCFLILQFSFHFSSSLEQLVQQANVCQSGEVPERQTGPPFCPSPEVRTPRNRPRSHSAIEARLLCKQKPPACCRQLVKTSHVVPCLIGAVPFCRAYFPFNLNHAHCVSHPGCNHKRQHSNRSNAPVVGPILAYSLMPNVLVLCLFDKPSTSVRSKERLKSNRDETPVTKNGKPGPLGRGEGEAELLTPQIRAQIWPRASVLYRRKLICFRNAAAMQW